MASTNLLSRERDAVRGCQEPRICRVPEYVSSAGREAGELCRLAGLHLDPWEMLVLSHGLGERSDGRWAAFEVGLVAPRQNGKGPHSLDTPILTTDGWTTFADIAVGQSVYGADGEPTRVVAGSDVFFGERCYEVAFTDGSRFVVGSGHLWRVWDKEAGSRTAPRGRWRTMATADLAGTRWGWRRTDNGRMEYRYRVRCDAVPQTPEAALPIDPYLFGYWLGDGTHTNAAITVGAEDREWVEHSIEAAGASVVSVSRHAHGHAWSVRFRLDAAVRDGFESRCRRLGVWGNKHIPGVYLTASAAQRRALLAGLMDSDGHIATTNRSPQVELCSSCPALATDIARLLRSLGIRVTPRRGSTACRDRYRFLWTPTFNPFRLPRKAAKYRPPVTSRQTLMSVTEIREVPSVPVRCIQVERPDGVYLVGYHFTPTHNSILEARELTGLFLLGERLIIHSAHEQITSSEHFRRLLNLIEGVPEFDRRVLKAVRGKGSEAIELRGGQRVMFKTRTGGGGRGLTGDLVVLDEAMILPLATIAALVPTMAARSIEGNPQLWYAGSAVDQEKHEHGLVLARLRERALGDGASVAFCEWSVEGDDPNLVPDEVRSDPASWAQANPGLGIRISMEHVANECAGALGPREFAVERLGIGDWPDTTEDSGRVIAREAWALIAETDSGNRVTGIPMFAVDASPDRAWAAIGVAGVRADGLYQFATIAHERGTGWVVERAAEIQRQHETSSFVVEARGPAASLVDDMEKAGVRVIRASTEDYGNACDGFVDAVVERRVRYPAPQPELDDAIAAARAAPRGDRWKWARRSPTGGDITPLIAVTLALWGTRSGAEFATVVFASDAQPDEPDGPMVGPGFPVVLSQEDYTTCFWCGRGVECPTHGKETV